MSYNIYNPEAECMPREKLAALQSERLVSTVKRVYEKVPAYKKKFDDAGVKPEDIKSVKDLSKLPFTYKQDLRDNYPYGLFAVPMDEIVRIHASSGTTGKQTVVGYTRNDLKIWGEVMARTIGAGGVTSKDIGHISYGYGLFTGGLGGHIGSETIGAATIPASTGNTARQVTILQDFKPTFLLCTPSYALTIAEYMAQHGITKDNLCLKYGFFGAEPWTRGMQTEIENRLGIECFDIYGLSEIIGPGVAYECQAHNGLHVSEDHFILEIIDPKTGEVLPEGEKGELVFTCITKEALPLIRYRTHDVGYVIKEPCACGRTCVRIGKLLGRSDDMLIIRGVNVFPSQIEGVLTTIDEIAPHYQIIVDRIDNRDMLTVLVEMTEENFTDEVRKIESMAAKIKKEIENVLGISVNVRLVAPQTITRFEGKAVRVVDNRKLRD